MKPSLHIITSFALLWFAVSNIASAQPDTCPNYRDQWQWNDPVDPNVHCLPLVGIVSGENNGAPTGEHYGELIVPLGDINNDGLNDWAVTHYIKESNYGNWNDVLVYRGVRGGLPKRSDGYRIGASDWAT